MSRAKRKLTTANDNVTAANQLDIARTAIIERSHELIERIAFEVAKASLSRCKRCSAASRSSLARPPSPQLRQPVT